MQTINKQAHFSEDGTHRFWLLRSWEANPKMITIIGLNPSTANAEEDDPTIRSCIRLTKANGYGGFVMCNLFTLISSDPKIILFNTLTYYRVNHLQSNDTLKRMISNTHAAVCAWGSWNYINHRVKEVMTNYIKNPFCFGTNADGSPKHPLYLKSDTPIIPFKQ